MTPTEVLKEIRKMPLTARRQVLDELNDDLTLMDTNGYGSKELRFIESMKRSGLISQIPNRFKQEIPKRKFERVNVIGKPMSETIIEDRG